jgi:glutamine amidotransferase
LIAIVDYGSGNVGAIADIFKRLKIDHSITRSPGELREADRFILPGVGAFDTTMRTLSESGLIDVLDEQVLANGKRILGICVGMQILGDSSEEGALPGLGWIPGRVRRIDPSTLDGALKLPHMGWNSLTITTPSPLLEGVDLARGFYFLHSYFFDATDPASVLATVDYGGALPCAVSRGNVFGAQFHPEKSHANGLAIFRNFAAL